jgi:hypothetical protein
VKGLGGPRECAGGPQQGCLETQCAGDRRERNEEPKSRPNVLECINIIHFIKLDSAKVTTKECFLFFLMKWIFKKKIPSTMLTALVNIVTEKAHYLAFW